MTTVDPVERLPLSPPVFQVLLSLCEQPMHGYAILTDIQDRAETTVQLGAGTLYAAIRRMSIAGMVEECDPPAGEVVTDTRRRYYRLTQHGREIARAACRARRDAGRTRYCQRTQPPTSAAPFPITVSRYIF